MRELRTLYPRKKLTCIRLTCKGEAVCSAMEDFGDALLPGQRQLLAQMRHIVPAQTTFQFLFMTLDIIPKLNLHLVRYSRKSTSGAGIVDTPALQIRSDPTHGHRKSRHDRRTVSCILLQICGITILHRSMSHNCIHNPKLQVSYYQIYLNCPVPTTDT